MSTQTVVSALSPGLLLHRWSAVPSGLQSRLSPRDPWCLTTSWSRVWSRAEWPADGANLTAACSAASTPMATRPGGHLRHPTMPTTSLNRCSVPPTRADAARRRAPERLCELPARAEAVLVTGSHARCGRRHATLAGLGSLILVMLKHNACWRGHALGPLPAKDNPSLEEGSTHSRRG
jgi:hypothetical protein